MGRNMGNVEILKVLLNAGANVNHEDEAGSNALTFACQEGHVEFVRMLVELGKVDVNGIPASTATALGNA